MGSYEEFLSKKQFKPVESGFDVPDEWLSKDMFGHQKLGTKWALQRGRAALFFDTGLGKSICLLNWANCVARETEGLVLILAPLAVSYQIRGEGKKFGIDCTLAESDKDITSDQGIYITNYEKLDHFDTDIFQGVVLDESSILKGFYGRVRESITNAFKDTPYKLSTTATPSPNDFMELGTQSEFLGIMNQMEMLSMFFVNDTANTGTWRLKGHAADKFWEWMATWSIVLRKPSDLGFDDTGYNLPKLHYHEHIVETEADSGLFVDIAQTLTERSKARRDSLSLRCEKAAEIANSIPLDTKCLIWCDRNDESELLSKTITNAVEVKGADKAKHKEDAILGFAADKYNRLVSKPSICGYGINLQSCHHMIFTGLSDSFEKFYQAVRRCWRFGQTEEVHVHIIISDKEGAVADNIKKKQKQHDLMSDQMVKYMKELTKKQIGVAEKEITHYNPQLEMKTPEWLKEEVL